MDPKGKVVVISNRDVHPGNTDLSLFGDDLNNPPEDLNLALADKSTGQWGLELLTNPANPDYATPVSRDLFKEIIRQTKAGTMSGDWVFFVHGFNQDLGKNLDKCLEIAGYDVNVAAFSWPSNPGPQAYWKKAKEYKRARLNAERSVIALVRTLEKLVGYMEEFASAECELNLNLVVHSLGNYLFENVVKRATFDRETKFFSNAVLHQADADNRDHAAWVEKLTVDSRVYVTINEHDAVLGASDIVNPDRLGNTTRNLDANEVNYIDFTQGRAIGTSHRPWHDPGKNVVAVGGFYQAVFHGRRGETTSGWQYHATSNSYRLVDRLSINPGESVRDVHD